MPSQTGMRERIDLAGRWQLAFDPEGDGLSRGWATGRWPERSSSIDVPALWNLTHPDAEGAGFYRRAIALPDTWVGRSIWLDVGGASYRLEAWLNGRFVGSHEGSYTPCRFDVSAAARPGDENDLVLRVTSLSRTRAVDGMALHQMPASKQSWYYTYGGLWGDVALEAVSPLFVESIAVEPNLGAGTALFDVVVRNTVPIPRQIELHLTVADPTGTIAAEWTERVAVPPGTPRFAVSLTIPRPLPWSCDQPNLYTVRAELRDDGKAVDGMTVTFGMRDFTVRDGQFFLNDKSIYLKGALLQPNYPVGLIPPPNREMLEQEILLAKEAGFNMIRCHIRPAPPGYLDLTDRHGMLVYAESSLAWIRESPRMLDHGRREVQAIIERDRNHPSVVIWGIFNENRFTSALIAEPLIRAARALDATRVIVDDSGGSLAIDQDFGWIDRATVVPDRETAREPIQDIHIYIGAPMTRAAGEWLRTIGAPRQEVDIVELGYGLKPVVDEWKRELRGYQGQIFVSELGCGGISDLDETVAGFGNDLDLLDAREFVAFRDSLHEGFAARKLDRVFGSIPALVHAAQEQQTFGNRRQIEAVLTNPRVSGYCLTQLNDVCCEFHAGLLDLWRKPKLVFAELRRLNQPRCLVLRGAEPVVTLGGHVDVSLTVVDRRWTRDGDRVVLTVVGPNGDELVSEERRIPAGLGIKELGSIIVQTEVGAGEYQVIARLAGDDDGLMTTTETVLALPKVDWSEIPAVVWIDSTPPFNDAPTRLREPGSASAQAITVVADPGTLSQTDWESLFATVEAGGTGVLGPLRPTDHVALATLATKGIEIRPDLGFGNWMGCYHWVPESPLFAGLPAGGLAGEAYAEIIPQYIVNELGGEVLAGSFRNTESRRESPRFLWFSDVEVVNFGRGRLIFCQYRCFARAGSDPLAARLLVNLLRVAAPADAGDGGQ